MKLAISINTLFLMILLMAGSACSFSKTAYTNVPVNTAANTNATIAVEPAIAATEEVGLTPAALVADLYKQHDGKKSPFFQTKNRALVDKYFTKPLADLIWKDANNSSGEVGAIDGDPLYNAQDVEIKNFAIGKADIKGAAATVPVTFTNFGDKKTIKFALKQTAGAWKIDNILYDAGDSLMKWLKETYPAKPAKASVGEFEGKFLVGETSCTVKPVKMAFDVKWANGSGVETFVFKEGYSFESSDEKGANRFEFDDENYTTGTFYRADGKTFPVARTK